MGHQRELNITRSRCTVEQYYGAPTWLQHHLLSLHGGTVWGTNAASTCSTVELYWATTRLRHCQQSSHTGVVLGTNAALKSPAVVALWSCMGYPRGFDIACSHCTGAQFGAPTLLCHCHTVEQYYRALTVLCHCTVDLYYWAPTLLQHCPLSSNGGAVLGTKAALSLPTDIAVWSSTTGHQCCFDIACSHRGLGHQRGFNITCRCCTVEWYYGAPTRLCHSQQSSHSGAVLWGTNAALTSPAVIALWCCATGHQHCFDVACHHCKVEQ